MGIEYTGVVGFPLREVFDWHARPGAMPRLVPPWQPMTVRAEARSLADGTAELGLPGGLRWVAQHQPDEYRPPHRFVDVLSSDRGPASWPPRLVGRWRHTHKFAAEGPDATRLTDRIDAPVPAAALRPMFGYRHRQVAGDLAAHRDAAERGLRPSTIAITGASGLVGSALAAMLTAGGHRVIRLVRRAASSPDERRWDPQDPAPGLFDGVDAVVHLAGESIAGRFTAEHRRRIRDSRIGPTEKLARAAAAAGDTTVFVSASAIGFYGADRGDEPLTEAAARGAGFLADVVADWEAATAPAVDGGLRVVAVRTGIVQAARGGTLRLLRPLFAAGLGGRLGDGSQWLSWIGIDDLLDVYYRAIYDDRLAGPVNAVAPNPVRNTDYTAALGATLRRPAVLPVPAFGPKLLLGDVGARELALADQRVVPARLTELGHRFRHPDVEAALRHQLGRTESRSG
ncbi:TIGR01777 family oxidoreductase [Mycobacterium sp. MYCO198283]|uniref:TIGR01777 family oxidoreductase n=1 Tax=Mycobacterium sp. MYCO198283 TaxID=2883505 RepID=UPI001E349AB8|nr:TIGR01777 family oxidoreductase [Mycobacterium sp. MYCO198283]MCG5432742.1 TIGR01777 family oxidoreductase [Mycobacterium sp. MYCO198283]